MERYGFSEVELAACARRELAQRKRVYWRLVREGRMEERDAKREIALMRAIAAHFEGKVQPGLM